jgi:phosphate transport system substrate-binding protein
MKRLRQVHLHVAIAGLSALAIACGSAAPEGGGVIEIDGSSTVFPVTEAVAEEFQRANPGARVTVGESGTGGGFQKFCRAETAISDASRPIRQSEMDVCTANGVTYVELPVAYDGLTVVVNAGNTWAPSMTVAELKTLWEPGAQGQVTRWNQVRPGWPDEEIHLFGPGTASGTFDYFTEVVNGEAKASRGDYTSSEDDNVLVQGVANDRLALGYFGLAYFEQNRDKLTAVAIDDGNPANGDGPILPSLETVNNGTYRPLSRPIFIYVSTDAMSRSEVQGFLEFYLREGPALAAEVGYVPLTDAEQALVVERLADRTPGTMFGGAGGPARSLEDLLRGGR